MTDLRRIKKLNSNEFESNGPVIYWMSRDQRAHDNWALVLAQEYSKKYNLPLAVVFSLKSKFLDATIRHYDFMLKGLEQVETELNEKNISFFLLEGSPEDTIPKFIKKHNVSILITDFSPLRIGRKWRDSISRNVEIPMFEVDAHNIVPCWIASNKQEFGAYTLRPKIKKIINEFLIEIPTISKASHTIKKEKIDWKDVSKNLDVNKEVKPVDWVTPGYKSGMEELKVFIQKKLHKYGELRNDPTVDYQSNLSPYLHFGQISAQRVALTISSLENSHNSDTFLEELIVRKELADNYCYFNHNYDNTEGFPDWAKKTLQETKHDKREYLYTKHEFENSKTHDPLWNAAQNQMTRTGKMHGYLRMYWAKKLLEWAKSPEEALEIGIYLNDKYELDGRDPSGYTGLAWSIGGVHDRAWFPRPIFGKIRYMNYNGCKSKFDVEKYIKVNQ
jgi:deoxyribodipyrimidine photo-lyase